MKLASLETARFGYNSIKFASRDSTHCGGKAAAAANWCCLYRVQYNAHIYILCWIVDILCYGSTVINYAVFVCLCVCVCVCVCAVANGHSYMSIMITGAHRISLMSFFPDRCEC